VRTAGFDEVLQTGEIAPLLPGLGLIGVPGLYGSLVFLVKH